jgi:CMP-N,N'-diacetyllegionaminic acid synthase
MRILALITARGGSKRLPGKNIKLLGGKPLIVWSIDIAKNIQDVCDILISTDDGAIAKVGKEAGAYVPWLRPAELASDTASSVDVALHALDWYEAEKGEVDGVLLLQPTSPFRTANTLLNGIALFASDNHSVVGVSPTKEHPMRTLIQKGKYVVPFSNEEGLGCRSQDLPPAFVVNGSFYLISPSMLREKKSFTYGETQPLVIDSVMESVDIDTEDDWLAAEKLLLGKDLPIGLTQLEKSFNYSGLCSSTKSYLSEHESVFSLPRKEQGYTGDPRKIEMASIGGIFKLKTNDAIRGPIRYLRELAHGVGEISKLSAIKDSKQGKKAIVIGNGPSQGLLNSHLLKSFSDFGNDIFAVNFWNANEQLSSTPPQYLVLSDPFTLPDPEDKRFEMERLSTANSTLTSYLLNHINIEIFAPVSRIKSLRKRFGDSRVRGFIDTEMRWLTSNIDPRFPRGYLSMTLYKSLALAIHMGYDQIYVIGMDNTYPRNVYCDPENKIFNHEKHGGASDYIINQSSLYPSMDVWAQDMFYIFADLRRCFIDSRVTNLDCFSLTDLFPKVDNIGQIESILSGVGHE